MYIKYNCYALPKRLAPIVGNHTITTSILMVKAIGKETISQLSLNKGPRFLKKE